MTRPMLVGIDGSKGAAHGIEWAMRNTCAELEKKYGITYAPLSTCSVTNCQLRFLKSY